MDSLSEDESYQSDGQSDGGDVMDEYKNVHKEAVNMANHFFQNSD